MAHIEIFSGDNWVIIKKDGEQIYSDHRIETHDLRWLLPKLGHAVTYHWGDFGESGDDTVENFEIDATEVIEAK